ncbi:hypothetical protein VTP01DRAFT_7750 [Rhizomucor pusillus]|uniref:uncharacterized protein n=1 Tax=Rhizomucor pusillus TaxID=4840 RepID=UPI0037423AB7
MLWSYCDLKLPASVDEFGSFTTIKSLRNLVQLAHICTKLTAAPTSSVLLEQFEAKKHPEMQMEELENLLSPKHDRILSCVTRF